MKITLFELKTALPHWQFEHVTDTQLKSITFESINHDSRAVDPGGKELFIVVDGPKFDPHDFIDSAFENGAVVAICEDKKRAKVKSKKPLILVQDSKRALSELTQFVREKIKVPVVAITGSTGKSMTREMMACIFREKGTVLCADVGANINTLWGNVEVLMKFSNEDYVVLEVGVDTVGEIQWQMEALTPDIGCNINIGEVHSGPLGGVKNLVAEKKDMAVLLGKTGKPVVLNVDDERTVGFIKVLEGEMVTVSAKKSADIRASDVSVDQKGTHFSLSFGKSGKPMTVDLRVYGEGYVYNALCASAMANTLGVDKGSIRKGLEKCEGFPYRFEKIQVAPNITLINDAYNANPQSMRMSIKTFLKLWGGEKYYKIVILGDMLELGEVSKQAHEDLGQRLKDTEFDEVYYIGENYKYVTVGDLLESREEVKETIERILKAFTDTTWNVVVLIKASNGLDLYTIPAEMGFETLHSYRNSLLH